MGGQGQPAGSLYLIPNLCHRQAASGLQQALLFPPTRPKAEVFFGSFPEGYSQLNNELRIHGKDTAENNTSMTQPTEKVALNTDDVFRWPGGK